MGATSAGTPRRQQMERDDVGGDRCGGWAVGAALDRWEFILALVCALDRCN
jgi:hypothetical protein